MFVLYRLQIEEGRIETLRERMLQHNEDYWKFPFDVILKNLRDLEKQHQERDEKNHSKNIHKLLEDYEGATRKRTWLSRRARQPVIELILLTFGSLAGIAFYPSYAESIVGGILMWVTLLASIIPLYQIAHIISVSLSLD